MSDESAEKRPRVLIADDCPATRLIVETALNEENFELVVVEDGEQAIAAIEKEPSAFDAAVLDIQMPKRSGIEVCQWIKKECTETFIPVMLLTCLSEVENKIQGLNCGADEYVTKPFDLAELAARVRALLRIKDLTDTLRETRDLLELKEKELVAAQVAGAAAHELGQPLTALLLDCELLKGLDPDSHDFQMAHDAIRNHCKAMREILDKLYHLESYKTKQYLDGIDILDLGP